ncbi:acyl-CoA thioesterase [bacterium]|nr:acyl-CoA thioesterase [bacterium]
MKNELIQKVYYSDTDAYGHVWHGSYLRWLEMGRMGLCDDAEYSLSKMFENDLVLPVVEINIRYKSPAKLEEEVLIETELVETSRLSMTFLQKIYNSKDKKCLHVEAQVKVVATHCDGKLYRTFPDVLLDFIAKVGVSCQK